MSCSKRSKECLDNMKNATGTPAFASPQRPEQNSIAQKIDAARKTGKLDLSRCELTAIPQEVWQLTDLKELNLMGNELSTIPPEIGKLTALVKIDLSDNMLSDIPPEIGKLTGVKEIDLSMNGLTAVPSEIGELSKLESLSLWDNQLTTVPAQIGKLTNLRELDLSFNNLATIPPEIENNANLRVDLGDNPRLNRRGEKNKSYISSPGVFAKSSSPSSPIEVRINELSFDDGAGADLRDYAPEDILFDLELMWDRFGAKDRDVQAYAYVLWTKGALPEKYQMVYTFQ